MVSRSPSRKSQPVSPTAISRRCTSRLMLTPCPCATGVEPDALLPSVVVPAPAKGYANRFILVTHIRVAARRPELEAVVPLGLGPGERRVCYEVLGEDAAVVGGDATRNGLELAVLRTEERPQFEPLELLEGHLARSAAALPRAVQEGDFPRPPCAAQVHRLAEHPVHDDPRTGRRSR